MLTSIIVRHNHSGMNVSHILVLKPSLREADCSPCAKGGTVFLAVMQGEVTLTTAGAGALRLPACSLMYGPAALLVGLSASDDAAAITWSVDAAVSASMTALKTQPMDELTAIVLQDTVFERPRHPTPIEEGASCSRYGTVVAALDYLSLRLLNAGAMCQPAPLPAPGGGDARVQQARALMEASLDAPLTLADLAAGLACSPATLVRVFKTSGLPSPMRYLAALRVEHAKASLQQSELSISNIAASLGFRDLATFSHFFRKHTGQSPRDYRLNCRWLL